MTNLQKKFSIASPTRDRKQSKPIDWKACYICQDINVEQNLVKPFERPGLDEVNRNKILCWFYLTFCN